MNYTEFDLLKLFADCLTASRQMGFVDFVQPLTEMREELAEMILDVHDDELEPSDPC